MMSTMRADPAQADLTEEGRRLANEVARRHDVSQDAVVTLLRALDRGGGTQAQFSHPDLGGMGQWSQRGMIMVGDMFNSGLRARVDQLCNELAELIRQHGVFSGDDGTARGHGAGWWPDGLGTPGASGSQNDMRYACFPEARRLAIQRGGTISVYDTGDHRIHGVSQQQSSGQDLTFTSQHGTVRLHELARVDTERAAMYGDSESAETRRAPAPDARRSDRKQPVSAPRRSTDLARSEDDVFAKIERLHELQVRGVLTEDEFTEKKKDLLSRI